jgi:hypothetical protein
MPKSRMKRRKSVGYAANRVPHPYHSCIIIYALAETRNQLQEFLTNPDHGLDCYLSMRIRHGTLAGQLRTPLEVEHLITQRRAPRTNIRQTSTGRSRSSSIASTPKPWTNGLPDSPAIMTTSLRRCRMI